MPRRFVIYREDPECGELPEGGYHESKYFKTLFSSWESSKQQSDGIGVSADDPSHPTTIYSANTTLFVENPLYVHLQYLSSAHYLQTTFHLQANSNAYLLTADMCYNVIDKFPCGHEDKDWIPCEGFCETGTCSKPEPDQIRDSDEPKCAKCKEAAAEEEYLQEQLRDFSISDSLKPSTAPRVRDPNTPKKYFKWCIEWERCKHRSHSRPSDLERNDEDEEYLTVPGIGQCYDCSKAPNWKIAEMKQSGDYKKQDPWGALSRVEVAEGSSSDPTPQPLEAIAGHRSHAPHEKEQQAEDEFSDAPSPLPDRYGQLGMAEDSDDDTGAAKGKGRAGEPLAARAVEAAAESDDSGEEGQADPAKKKAVKEATKKTMKLTRKEAVDDEEEDEDEGAEEEGSEEDEEEDQKPAKRARSTTAHHTDDDGEDDDDASDEEGPGPEARKAKGKELASAEAGNEAAGREERGKSAG
ncbi:MAG: hypothetical protein L6R42_001082 [Xanthoria sp. 1 TBL-2021]|nr:MAG: hypothetical protein L6R42_001082 [Xanthoria sp. 1 TBL-2021]